MESRLLLPRRGTQEAETWVLERAYALLQGKVSEVAAGMRRSATRQGLSQEARAPVDKCADYLLKNNERFDYATALANGWPIATGIIEGLVVTWSRTAWTSPAPAGVWTVRKGTPLALPSCQR